MSDYKGKKLLILGGNVIHCKVVEAAREMGVYTIVTDYLDIKDAPAKQIADEALMLNVLDVDGIVDYCRKNGVDGVINFCNDLGQRPQQKICEKLGGIPSYGTEEQYFKLTDKVAFKKMCIENGVDVIPEYTREDMKKGTVCFPVLVKPVDSRGSRGQSICNNIAELEAALPIAESESSNGEAIIEKYMAGKQDFSMTYVFKDGQANLTRTGDRYLGKAQDGLQKQCIGSVSPSRNMKMFLENVNQRVIRMLQNEGFRNSPVFMQGFIDGDTVRFYDPGIRFPGTEYEKLLARATGVDLMKSMISLALGGEIDDYGGKMREAYKLDGKCSVQLLVSAGPGKIAVFDGLDEISARPEVVTVAKRYFPGETVPASGNVKQRICEIVLLCEDDAEKLRSLVEWVQSKLVVLDENGRNMLVSQFDASVFSKK